MHMCIRVNMRRASYLLRTQSILNVKKNLQSSVVDKIKTTTTTTTTATSTGLTTTRRANNKNKSIHTTQSVNYPPMPHHRE